MTHTSQLAFDEWWSKQSLRGDKTLGARIFAAGWDQNPANHPQGNNTLTQVVRDIFEGSGLELYTWTSKDDCPPEDCFERFDPQRLTAGDCRTAENVLDRRLEGEGNLALVNLQKLAAAIDGLATSIPDYGPGEDKWLALLRMFCRLPMSDEHKAAARSIGFDPAAWEVPDLDLKEPPPPMPDFVCPSCGATVDYQLEVKDGEDLQFECHAMTRLQRPCGVRGRLIDGKWVTDITPRALPRPDVVQWPPEVSNHPSIVLEGLPPGCYELEKIPGAAWNTLRLRRTPFNMQRPAAVPQGSPGYVTEAMGEGMWDRFNERALAEAGRVDGLPLLQDTSHPPGTPPDIAEAVDVGQWGPFKAGDYVRACGKISFPVPCGDVANMTNGRVIGFTASPRGAGYRVEFDGHDGVRIVVARQLVKREPTAAELKAARMANRPPKPEPIGGPDPDETDADRSERRERERGGM